MLKNILHLNIINDEVGHFCALLTTDFIFEFQVFYCSVLTTISGSVPVKIFPRNN